MIDLLFFWLLMGVYLVPVFVGLPWSWTAGFVAVSYAAAMFIVPLFLCRHCPRWTEPGRLLTCYHFGLLKLYRSSSKPLNRLQKACVFLGFVVFFSSGVVLLSCAGQMRLAIVAAYEAIAWVSVMRNTLCLRCCHGSCPM